MKKIVCCISLVFLFTACTGHICKNQEQSVIFSFNHIFQTVDVGSSPTYKASDSWVEKIFVSDKSFLVITKQKHVAFRKADCQPKTVWCVDEGKDPTIAKNIKACEKNKKQICTELYHKFAYSMQSYSKEEGYQHWENMPEEELISISSIDSRPALKASFHAPHCKLSSFSDLLVFFLTWFKAQ